MILSEHLLCFASRAMLGLFPLIWIHQHPWMCWTFHLCTVPQPLPWMKRYQTDLEEVKLKHLIPFPDSKLQMAIFKSASLLFLNLTKNQNNRFTCWDCPVTAIERSPDMQDLFVYVISSPLHDISRRNLRLISFFTNSRIDPAKSVASTVLDVIFAFFLVPINKNRPHPKSPIFHEYQQI